MNGLQVLHRHSWPGWSSWQARQARQARLAQLKGPAGSAGPAGPAGRPGRLGWPSWQARQARLAGWPHECAAHTRRIPKHERKDAGASQWFPGVGAYPRRIGPGRGFSSRPYRFTAICYYQSLLSLITYY